ncbi:EcsC family protein [Yoonia maricola]|uniref:EcsC family protein n=1 Tax=Yoonia maricola TaxID=420999 RepID=A0A2M8WP76_9RHOB|nr:EcsC family protein [Yoonia maricola]PJI92739.1 EcsC family protein [Yoonia maricola]
MKDQDTAMKEINPADPPKPLSDAAKAEIAELAMRQRKANGVLMSAINFVGGQVEDGLKLLPVAARDQIDDLARAALRQSFDVASKSRTGRGGSIGSDRVHKILGTLSGALGGFGGLPTALAELPVATTVIFRAVHHVAVEHGEDPDAEETKIECLAVFGAGGPGTEDDGVDTAFIGARLSISGAAVNGLISKVAPRFAAVLSQKLATQAVPILGAAAGAGTNYAFVDYYVAMAHVHFGLRRLARIYGDQAVTDHFHAVLAAGKLPQT